MKWAMIFLAALGAIFLIVAIVLFAEGGSIHETVIRYDDKCTINYVGGLG